MNQEWINDLMDKNALYTPERFENRTDVQCTGCGKTTFGMNDEGEMKCPVCDTRVKGGG